jgi:2-keto-4-pentenoate hydratase
MLSISPHPFCESRMPLSTEDVRAAAERLDRAEKSRTQIRQLSQEFPAITIDDAYAIQKAWMEIKTAGGRVVKGHKIGLTSKAMQSALNIDKPDSGVLLDDMFFADGGIVPTERFIATRVEAELAFIMAKRLSGPDCTMFDVLNATDFVVPALEILDTRIERVDPKTKATRKIFDTIALDRRALFQERATGRDRACRRRAQSSGNRRWPGLRTRWLRMGSRSSPDRSFWRDRSSVRSRLARATQSRPIMAPTAR